MKPDDQGQNINDIRTVAVVKEYQISIYLSLLYYDVVEYAELYAESWANYLKRTKA